MTKQFLRMSVVVAAVGLLLEAAGAAQNDQADKLPGRWRSVETSRGGIGSILIFQKGGRLESSPGAIVDMSYRVEDDQLILPSGTNGGPEARQTMTWLSNDRLRLGSGKQGIELTRKSSAAGGPRQIIGEWGGRQDMGGQKVDATYLFYPEGKGLLVIPFIWERGKYAFSKGSLRLTLPRRPAANASFTINGEVMALTIDGQTANYRKY